MANTNNHTLSIGILGCSAFAKRTFINQILTSGLFTLKAIASRSAEKANAYAALFECEAVGDYQKLLDRKDIEVIYMPLPVGLHFEWLHKAIKAGKHVLVEKSFTENYPDTECILKEAKAANLCVFENFMFPFHSQMHFVHDKLKQNIIGEIKVLRSAFGFPKFDEASNIRYIKELGGGALLDAGAYTTLAAQFFLGRELKVIGAVLSKEQHEVDFNDHVLLQNEKGICAQLSFGFDHFYQNNIELWGTKGRITMKRAFTAGPDVSPVLEIETPEGAKVHSLPPDNHFHKLLQQFHWSVYNKPDWQFEQIAAQSLLLTTIMTCAHE